MSCWLLLYDVRHVKSKMHLSHSRFVEFPDVQDTRAVLLMSRLLYPLAVPPVPMAMMSRSGLPCQPPTLSVKIIPVIQYA